MELITDVSEMGELWSPNTPPPITAATTTTSGVPVASASGTAMGIRIANVPQLVPVEKATNAPMTNTRAGRRAGLNQLSVTDTT